MLFEVELIINNKAEYEYVVNLRKIQRTSKLNTNSLKINVNDFVLVYDEKVLIHFWRIAILKGYYLVDILK